MATAAAAIWPPPRLQLGLEAELRCRVQITPPGADGIADLGAAARLRSPRPPGGGCRRPSGGGPVRLRHLPVARQAPSTARRGDRQVITTAGCSRSGAVPLPAGSKGALRLRLLSGSSPWSHCTRDPPTSDRQAIPLPFAPGRWGAALAGVTRAARGSRVPARPATGPARVAPHGAGARDRQPSPQSIGALDAG